jgi:hypothetical protein
VTITLRVMTSGPKEYAAAKFGVEGFSEVLALGCPRGSCFTFTKTDRINDRRKDR